MHLLSSPLLFLSMILPAPSFAQLTSDLVPSTTPKSPAPSAATAAAPLNIPSSFSTAISPPASITSSILPLLSSSISNASTPITADNAPQLYPASTSPSTSDNAADDRKTRLLNYYFVFLAFFALLLCAGVYLLHRRKRQIKSRLRNSGQNALARDLDGWVGTARWVHGSWRGGAGGGLSRREEGLNEHGEAPPPYQPLADATTAGNTDAEGSEALRPGTAQDAVTGLTIPLRTLSRDGRATLKPPGYQDTIHPMSIESSTRPNTAELPPNSSTGDLLRDSERRPDLTT